MCNREAPSVEEAAQKWAGKVNFIGVAWAGSDASFQGFVDKYNLSFPTLSDDPGNVYQHFEVPAQPAFVIVAADGTTQVFLGAVEAAVLDDALASVTA